MNDRMQIAAMAMQGMLNNSFADDTPEVVAKGAVAYAGALLKALAESEAERPQFTTSDDQRLVAKATGLGDVEFLTPYASPQWWGAVPGDATTQSTSAHDEVGDWREYVRDTDAVKHVSCGDMEQALAAFAWISTPQGYDFWEAVYSGDVSALTITRAQRFAGRVLEAMEASDE